LPIADCRLVWGFAELTLSIRNRQSAIRNPKSQSAIQIGNWQSAIVNAFCGS